MNDTFIETVSKTALEAIQLVSNAADDEDDQELADRLSKTLNQVAFDLKQCGQYGAVLCKSDKIGCVDAGFNH